jgi:3-isopropylmalate/(R)-2-methylmalate dehydratase small subunit
MLVIQEKVAAVLDANIDTDVIFPTRYVASFDVKEIAPHVFEDAYPGFYEKTKDGAILIAGPNFGCGSAREQAASSLKGAGVCLIIAPYFSRSFYRNALNVGLPLLEIESLLPVEAGDELLVDIGNGALKNKTKGTEQCFTKPDRFVVDLIESGGICKYYMQTNRYQSILDQK